jgi:hypothetical protein
LNFRSSKCSVFHGFFFQYKCNLNFSNKNHGQTIQ